MPNPTLTSAIDALASRRDLSADETADVLNEIMHGEVSETQIAGFLIALRTKGETVDELAGLARTMRALAVPVPVARDDLLDTAGTGGVQQIVTSDGHGHCKRAHRARQAGQLVDRLALRAQSDQEARDLRLGHLPVHDLVEHVGGLVGAQIPARGERVDRAGEGRVGHQPSPRKFASSFLPWSVSTDSG